MDFLINAGSPSIAKRGLADLLPRDIDRDLRYTGVRGGNFSGVSSGESSRNYTVCWEMPGNVFRLSRTNTELKRLISFRSDDGIGEENLRDDE